MKKYKLITILTVCMILILSGCTKTTKKRKSEDGSKYPYTIEVKSDGTAEISLDGSAASGYKWTYTLPEEAIIDVSTDDGEDALKKAYTLKPADEGYSYIYFVLSKTEGGLEDVACELDITYQVVREDSKTLKLSILTDSAVEGGGVTSGGEDTVAPYYYALTDTGVLQVWFVSDTHDWAYEIGETIYGDSALSDSQAEADNDNSEDKENSIATADTSEDNTWVVVDDDGNVIEEAVVVDDNGEVVAEDTAEDDKSSKDSDEEDELGDAAGYISVSAPFPSDDGFISEIYGIKPCDTFVIYKSVKLRFKVSFHIQVDELGAVSVIDVTSGEYEPTQEELDEAAEEEMDSKESFENEVDEKE